MRQATPLPQSLIRQLTNPAFTKDQFTSTAFVSADEKADFANRVMRFIAKDCPPSEYTYDFHRALTRVFGFSQAMDRSGFWITTFTSGGGVWAFLKQAIERGWQQNEKPGHSYSDVGYLIAARLSETSVLEHYQRAALLETEQVGSDMPRSTPAARRVARQPAPSLSYAF